MKSCQIGIKRLSRWVILNLGYPLSDSRMKWYWRSVNPNPIVLYRKINFGLLIFQRWTTYEKSDLVKNHVCQSTSCFPVICFRFARCTLARRWCIHQPVNIYRNCLKRYFMRYYAQKYRFPSKKAKWNKKYPTVLKYIKKAFLFENIDKNGQTNYLFLGNS